MLLGEHRRMLSVIQGQGHLYMQVLLRPQNKMSAAGFEKNSKCLKKREYVSKFEIKDVFLIPNERRVLVLSIILVFLQKLCTKGTVVL